MSIVISGANVSKVYAAGDYVTDVEVKAKASLYVSGGACVSGVSVITSARLFISDRGEVDTLMLSAGTGTVSGGGVLSGAEVCSKALLYVQSGGTAANLNVSGNGNVNVDVYADDAATIITGVNDKGEFSLRNGVASNFIINSRGAQVVHSGAVTSDITVGKSATLTVSSGGSALGVTQESGGIIYALVSGGDTATLVSGSHEQGEFSLSGGVASNFMIYNGGKQNIHSGGVAVGTVASGLQAIVNVYSGGTISGATIAENASLTVNESASARDVDILNGGFAEVCGGATVSGFSVAGSAVFSATRSDGDDPISGGGDEFSVVSGGVTTVAAAVLIAGMHIGATGSVTVIDSAILTDTVTVEGSLVLDEGAEVAFYVSGRAGMGTALVSDWTKVAGTDYSIRVCFDAAPTGGEYRLAGEAAGFASPVSLTVGGETYAEALTVGGTYRVGDRDYSLVLDGGNTLTLTVAGDAPPAGPVAGDLNGDGRADVIMSIVEAGHGAEGATGAWLIQENQTPVWGDLSQRNAGWEIFGTGATAAGKTAADVYVKSDANVVGAWVTDDSGLVTGWETIGEFDGDTQVLGIGDFNGNGQSDLLLRNTNGAVGCFFTGGENTGWNYFQSLGDEWSISAVGDFNGDGRSDVALDNAAGFAGCWLTQADGTVAWTDLDTVAEGLAIVGAGDFDGDGTDDVLLKKDNYYGAWLVQNGHATAWFGLGDLGDVTVEEIADFDADGKDDLRIRTAAGDIGALLVRGEGDLEWKYYGSVGAEWSTALTAI